MGNKGESLRDYQPTIPQTIMREDMLREGRAFRDGLQDPVRVDAMFDEVVGEVTLSREGVISQQVPQLCYDIINQHELVLSLKQWQVVQNMMEQAMMAGIRLERDTRG